MSGDDSHNNTEVPTEQQEEVDMKKSDSVKVAVQPQGEEGAEVGNELELKREREAKAKEESDKKAAGGAEQDKVATTPKGNGDMVELDVMAEKKTPQQQPPAEVKQLLSGLKLVVFFIGMCLAIFLAALDQTIIATALPTITSELNGFADYSWVATAYLLTSTAFQPLYGRFSDIFGRKPIFLFAIITFEVGSLLCAVAVNMNMLIIARAIAGVGGGGIMSMVMIIIGDVINMRDRGKYQGVIGATFGVASVVGPLLGGAFTDQVSWRWCFYINLPFGAISVIVTVFFLHLQHTPGKMKEKILLIDYFGVFTLLPGVVALLLGVSWGGSTYAWNSAIVISMFVVAGVLIISFVVAEGFVAKYPIMPLPLFRVRNYTLMAITSFFVGFCMLGSLIYLPLYFQIVKGDDATASGLRMLPLMIGLVICSMGSGILIAKTGKYRFIPGFGTACLTLGMGILILLDLDSTFGQLVGLLIPSGVGLGWLMQTILLVTQASVGPKDLGVATAAVNFFRSIGGVVGVAVFGAVLNNTVTTELQSNPLFANQGSVSVSDFDLSTIAKAPPAVQAAVLAAFLKGIQQIFIIATPVAGASFISAMAIKWVPLRTYVGNAPPPLAD